MTTQLFDAKNIYQTYVSLGGNCAVAYWLKEYNLRNEAFPFDWCKVSLQSLINVLENNFINYSDIKIKKLSTNHIDFENDKPTYIIQNPYNISMAHEVVNPDTLDTFSISLIKRIDRFVNLTNPIFIRLEISNLSSVQMNKYNNLIELLDKYFTNYKIIVISINQPINKKIIWYPLNTFSEDWQYSYLDWKEIFDL
jgi:hypothetical protein